MNKVRKAVLKDVDKISNIIASYDGQALLLPLTKEYISIAIRDFFVYEENKKVLGCSALHIYSANLAEIRSLAVLKEYKGLGIGTLLAKACLNEGKRIGISKIFALTKEVKFFQKLGMHIVSKEELPEKVYKDCIHCKKFHHCDETAMSNI